MSDAPAFEDEDIPADIWATAKAMALESQGHPGVWSVMDSIARAIYIERERCAQIALQRTAQLPHDSDMTRGYSEGRIAAAAAIRKANAPKVAAIFRPPDDGRGR